MKKGRQDIIALIDEANKTRVRQSEACKIMGLSSKIVQRWHHVGNEQDGRIETIHKPPNKLSNAECQRLIATANDPE